MNETECYQIIKENYPDNGTDYEKLFQAVKSVADKVGMDKALELLGRRDEERRTAWISKNMERLKRSGNIFDDVLRIFYKECVGVQIGEVGEIIERTDKKLVTRWWNHCPILEACKKYGLDTREVCKKAYHLPNQTFLSALDSRLKFNRNYEAGIRPHAPYCEEIITVEG
jgi:hypothetical protein